MHLSQNLLLILVICAAILCAGCMQNPSSPLPVPPVTGAVAGTDPARLTLTPSDLPQGFTLVESRTKTRADLSNIALELGWQGGQAARFTGPAQNGSGLYEIVQSIAIYPEQTMPDVIALAERQGRSDGSLTYTDLAVQGLGDRTRAFSGKAGRQASIQPTPANPVISGINADEDQAVPKNDVAMIIFSKGTTFEVFIMTGPSPDTALLGELARKAYAKIP
jgi:hypothetical protein